jgi:hypothetical protein
LELCLIHPAVAEGDFFEGEVKKDEPARRGEE